MWFAIAFEYRDNYNWGLEAEMTESSKPEQTMVQKVHMQQATRCLLRALHFRRFFGQPLDSMGDAHNEERRLANNRRVEAYAYEAGKLAYYSGDTTLDFWWDNYPEAMNDEPIRVAMGRGFDETKTLHDGMTD